MEQRGQILAIISDQSGKRVGLWARMVENPIRSTGGALQAECGGVGEGGAAAAFAIHYLYLFYL